VHPGLRHRVDVGHEVAHRERRLVQRRGAGFRDVVARDVDRVVALHVPRAVRDAVADDAHRRRDGVDPLLLRLVLLQDVGLDRAREPVEVAPALTRQSDVHRQQDPRGRIDRHRHRDPLEVDAVEQVPDVGERVDRHTFAAHLAFGERVVAVVAHQRGHVEIGGKAGLPLADQILEAPVRVLGGAEARDLPHRPQAAPVHRRVGPARVRILPGQADVGRRRTRRVELRVDPLERHAAQRAEIGLPLGLPRDESRNLVLLPGFDLRRERDPGRIRGGAAVFTVAHASSLIGAPLARPGPRLRRWRWRWHREFVFVGAGLPALDWHRNMSHA